MTFIIFTALLAFILLRVTEMFNLQYDTYTHQSFTNDFSPEYNNFSMEKFNFMPSLKIGILNKAKFLEDEEELRQKLAHKDG